ncbi:MAG: hypothetical protein K8S54_07245 [Spirochaetia bacterium]|nr:hypothetical protein [Spirochaetia bacterium]
MWPSVHMDTLAPEEAQAVARVVERLPFTWLEGHDLLPQTISRRHSASLHFGRIWTLDATEYVSVIRIPATYLGGATERLPLPQQGISPPFQTNRVYFQSWLLPIEGCVRAQGRLQDFTPKTFPAAMDKVHRKSPEEHSWRGGSFIFDALDFSDLNLRLSADCSFGGHNQFLSIFQPFVIEFLSFCMHLLLPQPELIRSYLVPFAETANQLLESGTVTSLSPNTQQLWRKYYDSIAYERKMSAGGNPHWQFTSLPG